MIRFKLMTVSFAVAVVFAAAFPASADDALVSGLPCNSLCRAWMSMGQPDEPAKTEPVGPLVRQIVEGSTAAKPAVIPGAAPTAVRAMASTARQTTPLPPVRPLLPRSKSVAPHVQVAIRANAEPALHVVAAEMRPQAPSLPASPRPVLPSPFGLLAQSDVSALIATVATSPSLPAAPQIAEPVARVAAVPSPALAAEPKAPALDQEPVVTATAASPDVAFDAQPASIPAAVPRLVWAPPFDVIGALILDTPPARKHAAASVVPAQ